MLVDCVTSFQKSKPLINEDEDMSKACENEAIGRKTASYNGLYMSRLFCFLMNSVPLKVKIDVKSVYFKPEDQGPCGHST